eukprot:SM000061S19266  [mRNA]  locus=s61:468404:470692:- [translate_table: standard]
MRDWGFEPACSSVPAAAAPTELDGVLDGLLSAKPAAEDRPPSAACLSSPRQRVVDGLVEEPKTGLRFPVTLVPAAVADANGNASGTDSALQAFWQVLVILCHQAMRPLCRRGRNVARSLYRPFSGTCIVLPLFRQVLAGVGARTRSLVKLKTIKVYAYGVCELPDPPGRPPLPLVEVHSADGAGVHQRWALIARRMPPADVRPAQVHAALAGKYGSVPPEQLKLREDFFVDCLKSLLAPSLARRSMMPAAWSCSQDIHMTLRLIVYYKGLNMKLVKQVFETSLRNRLQKLTGADTDPGLKSFTDYFDEPMDIRRGTVIDFQREPGGIFITEIAGRRMGSIKSPDLCRAFFDIFIGDPPVSTTAKKAIGEALGRMLVAC